MNRAVKAWHILNHLGPRIVWLRAGAYLDKALGRTRKHNPLRPWDSIALREICRDATPDSAIAYAQFKRDQGPGFLFPLGKPPSISPAILALPTSRTPDFAQRIELLRQNRCVYFFHRASDEPIDWYHNPLTDKRCEARRAWYEIPDFRPDSGDIRTMWEPARAAFAIDLARAPSRGICARKDALELFWRWLDSWLEACPPFTGFQWKCGQEAAVRLIALSIGFWSLTAAGLDADVDAELDAERWTQFARLAWITGQRIATHISYAVSQKNNHALSEACGLMLIARLFPEFRDAPQWAAMGRRILTQEVLRQVYADGAYVQQSMNYHRVMLNITTLGVRLAELANDPLPATVLARLRAASEFLFQMIEPSNGRVPNYGNNDGAHVLPLSECDFTDFRPALQSAHFAVEREPLLPRGAWDEDLIWLFGADAARAPSTVGGAEPERSASQSHAASALDRAGVSPQSSAFSQSGYYTLRADESWALIRCHTYRDRQHHLDTLHVDLWWRGLNILRDCGSYQYYTPENPLLERYFKSVAAHNVIEIDGQDPFTLASRFLWLPWSRAREIRFQADENLLCFEGEHFDYARRPWRVTHRRSILCLPLGTWMIVDDLIGGSEHRAILRWHLIDAPHELDTQRRECHLRLPAAEIVIAIASSEPGRDESLSISRGVNTSARVQGWESPYFGFKSPIPTLEFSLNGKLPRRIITTVGPQTQAAIAIDGAQRWRINDAGTMRIVELSAIGGGEQVFQASANC